MRSIKLTLIAFLIFVGNIMAFSIDNTSTDQLILKHSYTFDDGTANDQVGTADGILVGTGTVANGVFIASTDGIILRSRQLILQSILTHKSLLKHL